MSQTPETPQAFEISRYDLELRLLWLNEKLKELRELYDKIFKSLAKLIDMLEEMRAEEAKKRLINIVLEFWRIPYDAVYEVARNRLGLDVDIEKYERQYGVRFARDESKKLIGATLMRDSDTNTVKPVVVYIDYEEIWYSEGEKE